MAAELTPAETQVLQNRDVKLRKQVNKFFMSHDRGKRGVFKNRFKKTKPIPVAATPTNGKKK